MSETATSTARAAAGAGDSRASVRPAIEASGLTKTFRGFTAVDGVDISVRQGEVVAFLGPNGAGKTSTIDMLLGLSQPDRGEVRLFGLTPRQAIGRGLVSAVMQTGGLLGDVTVRDTMKLTASLFAQTTSIDAALKRAGIADIADRKVSKCSGGQQQRLRFAMALVSDPGLIVLDEPTTGMDVEGRHSFWQAIHADARRGRTVLFATHYLEEADQYADRIILIRKGRIAVGAAMGITAPLGNLIGAGVLAWLSSLMMTSLGLAVGYAFTAQNAMRYLGPILPALSFMGGLFFPLYLMPEGVQIAAKFTPVWGIANLSQSAVVGAAPAVWVAPNLLVWFVLFTAFAVLMFRRDTRRV